MSCSARLRVVIDPATWTWMRRRPPSCAHNLAERNKPAGRGPFGAGPPHKQPQGVSRGKSFMPTYKTDEDTEALQLEAEVTVNHVWNGSDFYRERLQPAG